MIYSRSNFYPLLIIGGGPAGLSAALNAASEGISVALLEATNALGGQARNSSRIENYLGFPQGLSGPTLTSRAHNQAKRFGAEFFTGHAARHVERDGRYRSVILEDGSELVTKALLVACGLVWRKLAVEGMPKDGKGVYYGMSMADGLACKGKDIAIVGGANSAGQAALYFAKFARSVTMLVRAGALDKGMSEYLIERIQRTDNIDVLCNTEVSRIACADDGWIKGVEVRHASGIAFGLEISNLFIFIGAQPQTEWVSGQCEIDEKGFVMANEDKASSCPGIFVAGDVRKGSTKRIANAVGEGAHAVAMIHRYLKRLASYLRIEHHMG